MADSVRYRGMNARELRDSFLLDALDAPGEIRLAYLETDRAVVGMASPIGSSVALPCDPELRAKFFLERRELGALNIGGAGSIRVGGEPVALNPLDCLYIGRGNAKVEFISHDAANPAIFYLLSYPAHADFPVRLVPREEANPTELGSGENANH